MNTKVALAGLLMCVGMLAVADSPQSIQLSAELDKGLLLADKVQTLYLRVGLTGCYPEKQIHHTSINLAIVIDKSGSMSSDRKIEKAREAALMVLDRLDRDDILSVVAYDSTVEVLIPATRLTDKDSVRRKICQLQAGGSTALYAGVEKGGQEVSKFLTRNKVSRIILLSDGQANVGPSSSQDLGRLGSRLAEDGIAVTTIGLGLGYNEDLMSKLAYLSDGGHYFVERADQLSNVFEQELSRALSAVASQIKIEITCPKDIRPVRTLGRSGTIDGRKIYLDMNHIYSGHEKFFLIELEASARPADFDVHDVAEVIVTYRNLGNETDGRLAQVVAAASSSHADKVEERINKRVMADVAEQLAVDRNELAMKLRDEGKLEEARQKLKDNAVYLQTASKQYDCERLGSYGAMNSRQAEQLDDTNWNSNRKEMVEEQAAKRTQR